MDLKSKAKRLVQLNNLNNKVKEELDRKVSYILNNQEHMNITILEDVSKMLSLEWKLTNQVLKLKNQLENLTIKTGAQR